MGPGGRRHPRQNKGSTGERPIEAAFVARTDLLVSGEHHPHLPRRFESSA
jgi:hypothetical protein